MDHEPGKRRSLCVTEWPSEWATYQMMREISGSQDCDGSHGHSPPSPEHVITRTRISWSACGPGVGPVKRGEATASTKGQPAQLSAAIAGCFGARSNNVWGWLAVTFPYCFHPHRLPSTSYSCPHSSLSSGAPLWITFGLCFSISCSLPLPVARFAI